jgi:putative N6-adenine-specific DNA methylase
MKIVVRTYAGFEEILKKEIEKITNSPVSIQKRAVTLNGDMKDVYKINIWSRLAIDVLVEISSFTVFNEKQLYSNVYKINWSKYMGINDTFSISSIVYSRFFSHTKYVALKTKDAIADYFRDKYSIRPNVERNNPDFNFVIKISEKDASVLWNTSGNALFKRGYRQENVLAPLNEILAAGILKLISWDKKTPLIDPMCGGGTFLCEAAMMSSNFAPGLLRKKFGFEKSNYFNEKEFEEIVNSAKQEFKPSNCSNLYAYDIDKEAISISKNNLNNISSELKVDFSVADFFTLEKQIENGILLFNPPYDQRIQKDDIIAFYNDIGSRLKHFWENYEAWIISANLTALKRVGLKPKQKITLFNGPLECRLANFPLYKGSSRENFLKQKQ